MKVAVSQADEVGHSFQAKEGPCPWEGRWSRLVGGASSAPGAQADSCFPCLFPCEVWLAVGAQQTFIVGQWGGLCHAEEFVTRGL